MMKPFAYLTAVSSLATSVRAALPACTPESFASVLPANATIVSAVSVANGSSYGEGAADLPYPTNPTNLPASCALIVNVTTSAISNTRFGVFLPEQWNGRFMTVGNGGFAGGINWLDMGAGIRYGFAVVSTDTGHNSTTSQSTWALNNPERRADFGYRAIHLATVLGKALTETYYSQSISYSYYSGSSTGGRQGLREAQYDPTAFDGLLVCAPAWWTSHLQPWTTKLGSFNLPVNASNHVSADLFPVVGAEVIRQCDGVDGVVDGIVSEPQDCDFDFGALECGGTDKANASACLSADQVTTLKSIYADYITADGRLGFPGLELGSEAQWPVLLGGSAPNNLGDGYIADFLLNDPSWNYTLYNDSLLWQADAQDPGNCTADHYSAMAAVRDAGSKILMFHGDSDGLIAPGSSRVLLKNVASALYPNLTSSSSSSDDDDEAAVSQLLAPWWRFFRVPGMEHVTQTPVDAPWYFAQPNGAAVLGTSVFSVPGFADAEHDALLALMRWVEEGVAPEQIVATTWVNSTVPSSGVLRQRPLCLWPGKAVYKGGEADVDEAVSWECQA